MKLGGSSGTHSCTHLFTHSLTHPRSSLTSLFFVGIGQVKASKKSDIAVGDQVYVLR